MSDLLGRLLVSLIVITFPIWGILLWYPGEVVEEVKFRIRDWWESR